MIQRFLATLVVMFFVVGMAAADTATGKIVKVDTDKNTVQIKDDKDKLHQYNLIKSTTIVDSDGKELEDGLKNKKLEKDAAVTITYTGKGKKLSVSEVKLVK